MAKMPQERFTAQPPADVRERVAKEVYLWEATRFGADESWALRSWEQESNTRRELYFNVADRILSLLRTPRGEGEASGLDECIITCMGCGQDFDADDDAQARYHEAACEVVDYEPARVEIARRLRGAALRSDAQGEAQPWRKVGEEPPPNGVQVLAYDPRPDGYSYAGCWAYTLIRKGDEYYLDGERCDEEDRSRLRIEEWLWQPLPPYPGSRSKYDGVRDAALHSDA